MGEVSAHHIKEITIGSLTDTRIINLDTSIILTEVVITTTSRMVVEITIKGI
jgi:hypothetical protein